MFLSIVVPVYNVEKYIAECLDSLLCQNVDKSEYEIICVDDKSTDSSAEIIEKYVKSNGNLKLIRLPENKGVSVAKNTGIDEAKGDYIWFVDGDDIIVEDSFGDIFYSLKSNNYPDLLRFGRLLFNDGEKVDLTNIAPPTDLDNPNEVWLTNKITKRSVILDNEIRFDINVHYSEDDIFETFCDFHIKTVGYLYKTIYLYRQRAGSAMNSSITEKTLLKQISTYSAKLKYGEKYEFFYYLKDDVYRNMPTIIRIIACERQKTAKAHLQLLKDNNLFPIKEELIQGKKKGVFSFLNRKALTGQMWFGLFRAYIAVNKMFNRYEH